MKHPSVSPPQNVLITGATGGIGSAVARRFAQRGYALFLHGYTSREKMASLQAEIPAATDVKTGFYDLWRPEEQDALCDEAWSWRPGGIHILVQCAGVDILTAPVKHFPYEEKLRRLLAVDVTAGMRIARNIGKRILEVTDENEAHGSRAIINIGWEGVHRGIRGESGELFSASKGAIMAFTKSLAQKVSPQVRVNCVAPGWIQTLWGQHAPEAWQKRVTADSLTQRWGTPEEVAEAIFFLASDAARYINGQIINIDGGVNTTR